MWFNTPARQKRLDEYLNQHPYLRYLEDEENRLEREMEIAYAEFKQKYPTPKKKGDDDNDSGVYY